MKLSYKITNRPTITTSQLISTTLQEAMFYLYKEDDIVSFNIEVKNPDIDISSKIYSIENLKTSFKVKANTTDIMITNISINNTPYYYEIKTSDNSVLTLKDLTLNSDLDAVEFNGSIYSNSYINNYEIKDGTFIYSIATVDSSSHNVKYYSDNIQISVPKKKTDILYAKTRTDSCISLSKINDNAVNLSSFYIKTRSKVSQFIEGDVLLLNKKELAKIENNFIKLKDKAINVLTDGYLNPLNNTLYISDSYLTAKDIVVEYVGKKSSHMFEIDSELYLKLFDNNIIRSTLEDCDFIVKKKIDPTKFYLKTNDYLDSFKYIFKASRHAFLFTSSLPETKKKMFTSYTAKESYINPSEDVYIKINDTTYLQEDASQDIPVKMISKENVYDYLEDDYTVPSFTIRNKEQDKRQLKQISKNIFRGL